MSDKTFTLNGGKLTTNQSVSIEEDVRTLILVKQQLEDSLVQTQKAIADLDEKIAKAKELGYVE